MTLSVESVLAEDFDFKSIKDSFVDKKQAFIDKASKTREELLRQKTAANNQRTYTWVSDDEIFSVLGDIPDDIFIMLTFDKFFLHDLSQKVSSYSGYSWYLTGKIGDWIARNDAVAKKAIFNEFVAEPIKNNIVRRCLISMEDLIEACKDKKILYLPQDMQERILELSNPEDANVFIESPFEKVRIKAYQKLGPIKHLDKMIEDSAAEVRLYAVNIISPRDQRLAKFVNDRSSRVFEVALSKIHNSLIPMMVGSNHLKKKRIKALLRDRMNSAQS